MQKVIINGVVYTRVRHIGKNIVVVAVEIDSDGTLEDRVISKKEYNIELTSKIKKGKRKRMSTSKAALKASLRRTARQEEKELPMKLAALADKYKS